MISDPRGLEWFESVGWVAILQEGPGLHTLCHHDYYIYWF